MFFFLFQWILFRIAVSDVGRRNCRGMYRKYTILDLYIIYIIWDLIPSSSHSEWVTMVKLMCHTRISISHYVEELNWSLPSLAFIAVDQVYTHVVGSATPPCTLNTPLTSPTSAWILSGPSWWPTRHNGRAEKNLVPFQDFSGSLIKTATGLGAQCGPLHGEALDAAMEWDIVVNKCSGLETVVIWTWLERFARFGIQMALNEFTRQRWWWWWWWSWCWRWSRWRRQAWRE